MFTSEERRGALLVLALILIGAGWDAARARRTVPPPPAPDAEPIRSVGAASSGGAGGRGPRAAGTEGPVDSAGRVPDPRTPAPLSLNRASAEELEALPGIGPVLARRIVEHRARSGSFRSVDELRAVRGVGPRLLARLRGWVEP